MKSSARAIAWAGLTAGGVVHAMWATGSTWPAQNPEQLGELVVGNSDVLPGRAATLVVAGGAALGGAVAAGALGEGRAVVGLRRLAGAGLLARAILGGDAALYALRLPPGGKQFQELDRRYYRPAFAILGASLVIGAKK